MKNKKIWLMGGFGNVLFQILAYRVIKSRGENVKYIDVLTEKNYITRILNWTIHEKLYNDFISKNDIIKMGKFKIILILFNSMISRKFNIKTFFATFYTNKVKLREPYSTNIFGYFQEKYFLEENKEELLKLGREIHNIYKRKDSKIIVHFRMGDSGWAKTNHSYYSKIRNLIKKEKETVFIATDSPKEALDFFKECKNISLTDSKSAIDDFRYMVSAKKLYCAPSTFSWWALHSLQLDVKVIIPSFFNSNLGIYIKKENIIWV